MSALSIVVICGIGVSEYHVCEIKALALMLMNKLGLKGQSLT